MVAVVAALAALLVRGEGNGSGDRGRTTIDYRLNGPEWIDPALLAAAGLLVILALVLWAARPPWVALLGIVLLPSVIAGSVFAVVLKRTAGRASAAEFRSVPRDASEDEVRAALGPVAGHGVLRTPAGSSDCLLWESERVTRHGSRAQHFFCFRDGRLVAREIW